MHYLKKCLGCFFYVGFIGSSEYLIDLNSTSQKGTFAFFVEKIALFLIFNVEL